MNDTLIFLVLAGIALVFKWLTKMAAGGADDEPKPSAPNEQRRPVSPLSEQERVRRFLEALGAPPGTEGPPPVRPRSAAPPPPVVTQTPRRLRQRKWAQPLPPLVTSPLPPPVVTEIPEPVPPPVIVAPPPPPLVVPIPKPRPLARAPIAVPLPAASPSLMQTLRTRGTVRQAIILKEILGPPRGLQNPFSAGVSF